MAINLIVENGAGVEGANSYVNKDYAFEYSQLKNTSLWEDNLSLQTIALINASKFLDMRYKARVCKGKLNPNQGLIYPVDSTGVPKQVMDATVELALIFIENGELSLDDFNLIKSRSVSIDGAVSESISYFKPALVTQYRYVDYLMNDLLGATVAIPNTVMLRRG